VTPKSRKAILGDLRRLGSERPNANATVPEVWPFGILSLKPRNPRDDRAVVLVSATVIEQGLESALQNRFSGLAAGEERIVFEEEGAPLREFGAKIRLAYALGIIGPNAKADLDIIRQIRNTFAHSRAVLKFELPEISAACELLTLSARWPNMMVSVDDPREVFIQTAFQYGLYLMTDGDRIDDPDEPKLRTKILS